MRFAGLKKWVLILAIYFILQRSPLCAQSVTGTNYGYNTTASGAEDMAFGLNVLSSGTQSMAYGISTTSEGRGTTAFGLFTTASGYYTTSFGVFTGAMGVASTAFGYWTAATGNYSTAFGNMSSSIGAGSTAFGRNTSASGEYATATGYRTSAAAYEAFVIGQCNLGGGNSTSWVSTDPLFEIGNGYVQGRNYHLSDALEVYKNGSTVVSGTLSISGSNPVLVQPAGDLSMGSFTSGPQPN
jgi:hypothetical protein